jgi:hypothetical protein
VNHVRFHVLLSLNRNTAALAFASCQRAMLTAMARGFNDLSGGRFLFLRARPGPVN